MYCLMSGPPGGRGGRGMAAMMKLMADMKRPGEEQPQEAASLPPAPTQEPPIPAPLTSAPATTAPPAVGGRGRAAILTQLVQMGGRGRSLPVAALSGATAAVRRPGEATDAASVASSSTQSSVLPTKLGRGKAIATTSDKSSSTSVGSTSGKTSSGSKSGSGDAGGGDAGAGDAGGDASTHSSDPLDFEQLKEMKKRKGEAGKTIALTANYVPLKVESGKGVFEYEVTYNPVTDAKSLRYKMLSQHMDIIGTTRTFDGVRLYLPFKLAQEITELTCTHPVDESPVSMRIRWQGEKRMGDSIHLYNVLFRRIMYILKYVPVGRNYYNPHKSIQVPSHRLELWPGYVTAVQEQEGGIMLCCDVSHRVLQSYTAYEKLKELSSTQNFQTEAVKLLVGSCILTRYNNKTYRVDDIDWQLTPTDTFDYRGNTITYVQYYKQQYNIDVKDPRQPLLVNRLTKKIRGSEPITQLVMLIPELCHMTGLTDSMRADFRIMKELAQHTKLSPQQRQGTLYSFIKNVNESPDASKVLGDWGLSIQEPLFLQGRVLGPELVMMGNKQKFVVQNADFSREVKRNNVLQPVNLTCWAIVYSAMDQRCTDDFIDCFLKQGRALGSKINAPIKRTLQGRPRSDDLRRAISDLINPDLQMVVVIMSTRREDMYNTVKKLCCVELPIPSQVIVAATLKNQKKLIGATHKIALQINCKLGGALWCVKPPADKLMVIGIDVYHDAASQTKKSVAGFVASYNRELTKYYSVPAFQQQGQELVDSLKISFVEGLKQYHQVNGFFPEHVVVFRDGVGDGQLAISAQHEVQQLRSCFKMLGNDYSPSFTVIIVQKRINTRLFAPRNGKLENPPPGTIVDTGIVRRDWWDYFVVPQSVNEGTVSPTHFIVIEDNGRTSPDFLQSLSYKLTHLYYNWPGAVRVPAPCQYAHKLAYIVGQNIHKMPAAQLNDRLWYL